MSRHGELQRDLAVHADTMIALGVPDLRPPRLPEQLVMLLDDPLVRAALPADRKAELEAYVPAYAHLCGRLAEYGHTVPGWIEELLVPNVL